MKRLVSIAVFVLLCVQSLCAATKIREQFVWPSGNKATGYLRIQNPSFLVGSLTVPQADSQVFLVNGLFSVDLQVYSGYTVEYHLDNTPVYIEYWSVPVSATPLRISAVRVSALPSVGLTVDLSQITQSAATTGQCAAWNGSAWAPAACGSGGGGAVSSVFARTGTVTAQTGDYTAAQVTNAVDSTGSYSNPAWLTALAWAKLTGVPSTFAPAAHASTHASGGSDPVSLDASQTATGTFAAARLPNPSASTLGGVQSKALVSHQFFTSISTSGVPAAAQPSSADLSDTTCAVTVGATPAMDTASCNGSGGSFNTFKLGPLAQNASPTFANGLAGRTYTIQVYQGTGTAFTISWPGNIIAPCAVDSTLSARTQLIGVMDSTGTNLLVQTCNYLDASSTIIQGPTRSAPGTPASGTLACWFDSTANTQMCKDSSANTYAAVKTANATSNQFVTNVDASGVQQKAAVTVVNGTSIPTNSTVDQTLITTASATGGWTSVPNCGDATHALSYVTSTHTFACQNITAAAGSTTLDAITAAGGANAINSADNAQTWKWTLTTASKTGFRLSENTASAATGTPILIGIDTLSTSTVNPFQVTAGGTANGVRVDATGKLAKIGTGSVVADAYVAASVNSAATAAPNIIRACHTVIGANNGSALAALDIAPQMKQCKIPYAATVYEIAVDSDAGTSSVQVQKRHCSTITAGACTAWTNTNLMSGELVTLTGGFANCARTATSAACTDGTTSSSSINISTTAIAAGDYIETSTATLTGAPKIYTVDVWVTVN